MDKDFASLALGIKLKNEFRLKQPKLAVFLLSVLCPFIVPFIEKNLYIIQ
jgi:hypothetical protein